MYSRHPSFFWCTKIFPDSCHSKEENPHNTAVEQKWKPPNADASSMKHLTYIHRYQRQIRPCLSPLSTKAWGGKSVRGRGGGGGRRSVWAGSDPGVQLINVSRTWSLSCFEFNNLKPLLRNQQGQTNWTHQPSSTRRYGLKHPWTRHKSKLSRLGDFIIANPICSISFSMETRLVQKTHQLFLLLGSSLLMKPQAIWNDGNHVLSTLCTKKR